MLKQVYFLSMLVCLFFAKSSDANQLLCDDRQSVHENEHQWRIGGKIHFEEESTAGYVGIKEINRVTRSFLKETINIENDVCCENAKILVKNVDGKIQLTHFEEKSRPGVGEEMHATLLYTQPRGFCDSETLTQVCKNLFGCCDFPPTIESVASRYDSIVKPDLEFEIAEAVLTKSANGASFVMLQLLFENENRLFYKGYPISAGLHMTLINFAESTLLSDESANVLVKEINQVLKGRKIKIGQKNGVADLEFGISGSSWRIRATKRSE